MKVIFPLDIELDVLDGESYRRRIFSRKRALELEPGAHQLVVHYYHIEDLDGNEHQTYRSPKVTLSFVAQAGTAYRVGFTPPAQDLLEEGGRGKVTMWIETVSGQRVEEPANERVVTRAVGAVGVVLPKSAAEPATSTESVAGTTALPQLEPRLVPADAPVSTVSKNQNLPAEMLRFWWEKASPAQRSAFKTWLESQSRQP